MWFAGQARRGPDAGRPKALRPGFHLERGQRVGLFGGSFNPPHSGHAHVARTAMAHLDLDRVLWLEGGRLHLDGPAAEVLDAFSGAMIRAGEADADTDIPG
jgi:hypothetical protein